MNKPRTSTRLSFSKAVVALATICFIFMPFISIAAECPAPGQDPRADKNARIKYADLGPAKTEDQCREIGKKRGILFVLFKDGRCYGIYLDK